LQEIKTIHPFSLPGFRCLRSRIITGEESRGGVAVLFKHAIWNDVYSVELEHDQVWFRLSSCPDFIFGAVYIAPADSPFHTPALLAKIQEMTVQEESRALIIGDFNARMHNLEVFASPRQGISYARNIDTGSNNNGKQLSDLCVKCNLQPVNHLEISDRTFQGHWTYKQGQTWKSQIDWALVSQDGLRNILDFQIIHDANLPTDHAPLLLKMGNFEPPAPLILQRTLQLGESYYPAPLTKRRVTMQAVNMNMFITALDDAAAFWNSSHLLNTSDVASSLADKLYDATLASVPPYSVDHPQAIPGVVGDANERWWMVLQSHDPRQIWSAINWKGTFDTPNDVTSMPSDLEFCQHYSRLLSSGHDGTFEFEPNYFKYVPILDDDFSPSEVEEAIKTLKSNKSAGLDGVPPGTLKWLSDDWIIAITYLFNRVFSDCYPDCWAKARLVNIFKKGNRLVCGNYRGISILQALAK